MVYSLSLLSVSWLSVIVMLFAGLGLFFGWLIGKLAKEEVLFGKSYFMILRNIFLLGFIFANIENVVVAIFLCAIIGFLLFKFEKDNKSIFFSYILFGFGSSTIFSASMIFIYGLCCQEKFKNVVLYTLMFWGITILYSLF